MVQCVGSRVLIADPDPDPGSILKLRSIGDPAPTKAEKQKEMA